MNIKIVKIMNIAILQVSSHKSLYEHSIIINLWIWREIQLLQVNEMYHRCRKMFQVGGGGVNMTDL